MLLKASKLLISFQELYILIQGMLGSMPTMSYTALVLAITIYIYACELRKKLGNPRKTYEKLRKKQRKTKEKNKENYEKPLFYKLFPMFLSFLLSIFCFILQGFVFQVFSVAQVSVWNL